MSGFNFKLFLVVLVAAFFFSCSSIYTVSTTGMEENKLQVIDSLKKLNKYFILRSGAKAYSMQHIVTNPDSGLINTFLGPIPTQHQFHILNSSAGKFKYDADGTFSKSLLKEAHLYVNFDSTSKPGVQQIKIAEIFKIEVPQHDRFLTRKQNAKEGLVVISVLAGVAALVVLGIAAGF